MLKVGHILAAHPSDLTTTVEDSEAAVEQIYPSPNSGKGKNGYEKSRTLLELMAEHLRETLFISAK